MSLFSLPLMLNAQSVDEMLQKVSAAIEAGQQGQAMSYFRQTISWLLHLERNEITTKLICSIKNYFKRLPIM